MIPRIIYNGLDITIPVLLFWVLQIVAGWWFVMRTGKVEDKAKNTKGVEENAVAAIESVERKGEVGQRKRDKSGVRRRG